jgi:hypothetical protein
MIWARAHARVCVCVVRVVRVVRVVCVCVCVGQGLRVCVCVCWPRPLCVCVWGGGGRGAWRGGGACRPCSTAATSLQRARAPRAASPPARTCPRARPLTAPSRTPPSMCCRQSAAAAAAAAGRRLRARVRRGAGGWVVRPALAAAGAPTQVSAAPRTPPPAPAPALHRRTAAPRDHVLALKAHSALGRSGSALAGRLAGAAAAALAAACCVCFVCAEALERHAGAPGAPCERQLPQHLCSRGVAWGARARCEPQPWQGANPCSRDALAWRSTQRNAARLATRTRAHPHARTPPGHVSGPRWARHMSGSSPQAHASSRRAAAASSARSACAGGSCGARGGTARAQGGGACDHTAAARLAAPLQARTRMPPPRGQRRQGRVRAEAHLQHASRVGDLHVCLRLPQQQHVHEAQQRAARALLHGGQQGVQAEGRQPQQVRKPCRCVQSMHARGAHATAARTRTQARTGQQRATWRPRPVCAADSGQQARRACSRVVARGQRSRPAHQRARAHAPVRNAHASISWGPRSSPSSRGNAGCGAHSTRAPPQALRGRQARSGAALDTRHAPHGQARHATLDTTQRTTTQRNATQHNATQRNATQRNATQRNATHAPAAAGRVAGTLGAAAPLAPRPRGPGRARPPAPPPSRAHAQAAPRALCVWVVWAAQHSTAQHSTAQHSTAQHSTAQHSTAQHSTAQHSTAQHSAAQRACVFGVL